MWIINGPVCYQNDKLDHTFHVDYALQSALFFLPNNFLICWVSVKMVIAQPSLSISLCVSALDNMA